MCDVATGQELALLSQGHYDTITCCAYSPITGHLWSAGLDGAILAWGPRPLPDAPPAHAASYVDDWLASATAGRGRQRQGGDDSRGLAAAAAAAGSGGRAGGKAALPDVDFWSDDDELLVGGWGD